MVKQRLTTADVAGEVSCLKRLLGMRLANIYDINPKAAPPKSDTPSNFTLKLRKHLRTRRLEDVRQLGVDRIIDLQFGKDHAAYHLILEFYASGNIVLTDAPYTVLTLLRSHRDDAKGMAIMARHPYPIHSIRYYQPVTEAALREAARQGGTWRGALTAVLPYGPLVANHCLCSAGLQPQAAADGESDAVREVLTAVRGFERFLAAAEHTPVKGYILTKPAKGAPEDAPQLFDSVEPMLFKQYEGRAMQEFETFDAALAEFFGKAVTQREQAQRAQQEHAATGKLERLKLDQQQRLQALESEAQTAETKASLLEHNHEAVDAVIHAMREALATGMSWSDLEHMVKQQRKAGNPVACMIDSMQLERSVVTLLLSNYLDEEEEEGDWDEEANTMPATKVEVDITMDAFKNAAAHYDSRRKHLTKHEKTVAATDKVVKAAEKRTQQQLAKVRTTAAVVGARKVFWFEKFHWFVSSENYIVLSGRDAQQNELLVKRYLRRGDVYVHADIHGASSTIVKNRDPDRPIPALTLSQAGAACVCRSAAWDAKIPASAWWVHHDQVSKSAPTGEYLTVGSFMVRGRKHALPLQPLVMGLGFLFRLEESSIAGHLGERAVRGEEDSPSAAAVEAAGPEVEEEAGPATALDAFLDGAVDPLAHLALGPPKSGAKGPHLSAHQRKQQKKGSSGPAKPPPPPSTDTDKDKDKGAAQKGNVRGKGGKAKRASKYAEQDEEDRLLALQLLQSQGEKKDRATRRAARKARREAQRGAQVVAPAATEEELDRVRGSLGAALELQSSDSDDSHAPAATPEGDEEGPRAGAGVDADHSGEGDPQGGGGGSGGSQAASDASADDDADEDQHGDDDANDDANDDNSGDAGPSQPPLDAAQEASEVQALLEEESVVLLAAEELARLSEVDCLTGVPRAGDILLHALPVCAPYAVLANYKHKVKLVPGTQRKGKAAKQAVEVLTRAPECSTRERDLIKAVPDTDHTSAMIGNVKVAVAGLQKLKMAQRKAAKGGRG